MSSRHYEDLWRDGVTELVAHLDAEFPEEGGAGESRVAPPKKLADWAGLYIAYVQTLRKLCTAHDGVAHPQKRRCLRATLDACLGRTLELRSFLVHLNQGVDVIDLGEQLAAAGLTPGALELPVPAYFREERAAQLAARSRALAAALGAEQGQSGGEAGVADQPEAEVPPAAQGDVAVGAAGDATRQHAVQSHNPLQQQPAADEELEPDLGAVKPEQAAAQEAGGASDAEQRDAKVQERRSAAAVAVQACVRGWLARRLVERQRRQEMEFLGMLPPSDQSRSQTLQQRAAAIHAQRKQRQAARQQELECAMVAMKASLRQQEGIGMREQMRDELNSWFLRSRDPQSGEYADLPEAVQGGSRSILKPLPPAPTPEEVSAAAKASRTAVTGGGRPARGGREAAAGPTVSRRYLAGLREALQDYMDVWHQQQPADPTLALLPRELQGLPPPRDGSAADSYDAAMVAAEVRPVVWEEVRLEADDEMRCLIQRIKETIKAGRAERAKEEGGKGKKGSKAAEAGKKPASAAPGKGSKTAEAGGRDAAQGQPVQKKRRDPTAGRSIEAMYAELAAAGLVLEPRPATVADFLGDQVGDQAAAAAPPCGPQPCKPRTGGRKANLASPAKPAAGEDRPPCPEPSLAQARQAVVASCILPLGAHPALRMLDAPRTVLLYGPPGSGKTLLAQAVAHQAGAALLDLSPAATACKYPGREAALMVHMVFKVARALAPAVVLVEGVEQVFVSDKARAALATPPGGEPPNRVRKALLAEVAELGPSDGVLVLCTSRAPQACVRRDERALRTFIQRYIQLPLPRSGDRHSMLHAFAQQEGLVLGERGTVLTQLTEGLSAGQLWQFVKELAARLSPPAAGRDATGAGGGWGAGRAAEPSSAAISRSALELLPSFVPLSQEAAQELREWTALVYQPLPPEEDDVKKQKK